MTDRSHRRDFLRLGAALTAGSLLPSAALLGNARPAGISFDEDSAHDSRHFYDVVIVGGGLSGLMAARTLESLGVTNLKVLEGRSRVGGRTLNQPTQQSAYCEAGGQWIGPTQTAIRDLMADLNIGSFRSYDKGRFVDKSSGSIGALDLLDYARAERRLNALSRRVPLDRPWAAASAGTWDAMTVEQWANQNMATAGGRTLLALDVESALAARPADVSLLWFLFYVHSATNLEHLGTKAQARRPDGGSHRISLEMAQQLSTPVTTGAQVHTILWDQGGALVQYGNTFARARKLIVAMMPKDVERIRFLPALPPQRRRLQRHWGTGTGWKFHAVYTNPWWRAKGFSGQAISDQHFIGLSADNSPKDGRVGILLGFPADESQVPAKQQDRYRATLDSFEAFFGPEARYPIDYQEKSWGDDPFTAGCVSPLAPGVTTQFLPAIRTPVGPIHWAGTETSEVWCGYMDGAVRAGQRAGEEVEALLP